ncbi:hypothetical protein TWF703_005279 [Orbilia oligospora]|uniref:Uncharacterized protein n=1 Tax=Orbilia oligospora TaxID=2813651 RepID=A0A7C8JP88_ORBOL|nr:hypothetical protein TWF703_005279 [Orbilia oligospora]
MSIPLTHLLISSFSQPQLPALWTRRLSHKRNSRESLDMRLYVAHSEIEQAHALLYLPSKATSSKGEKILSAGFLHTRKLLEDLPHGDGDRRILLFNFIYYLYNNAKIKADRADGNRGSGDDDGIDAALDEAIEFVEQGILEVDKDEDVLLLAAFMSKLLQLRYRRHANINDLRRRVIWIEQLTHRNSPSLSEHSPAREASRFEESTVNRLELLFYCHREIYKVTHDDISRDDAISAGGVSLGNASTYYRLLL